ncbi:site-specific integrase [Sutterella sp.]|uniref:tyrosine-type recombinase/integrase n=1 Tax=Sutterella sp. TaxID=1981025 RepID=UPI0026E05754|nr:site-specific integrase [Sutterella sp.]MDO5531913.1 site-specific integrase [Sutterella sp.]
MKITERNVFSVKDGCYLISPQLFLVVRGDGKYRSYVVKYTIFGKRKEISLGNPKYIPLQLVKEESVRIRQLIADGIDPREERDRSNRRKLGETFEEYTLKIWKSHCTLKQYKSEKTAELQMWRLKKWVFPYFKDKPISEVKVSDVVGLFKILIKEVPGSTMKIIGLVKTIFNYALRDGLYEGINPASWENALEGYLPEYSKIHKRKHYKSVSIEELREYLLKGIRNNHTASLCISFIALSACRNSEIRLLKWGEIDCENQIINIPADRRKDGIAEDFRVPMVRQMNIILDYLSQEMKQEYVFYGRYNTCYKLGDLGVHAKSLFESRGTIHGMRSTFRVWAAENGVDTMLAEKCLMHNIGNKTYRAYQRSDLLDQRKAIMQRYADELLPLEQLEEALSERNDVRDTSSLRKLNK